jgi:hypothetical protein
MVVGRSEALPAESSLESDQGGRLGKSGSSRNVLETLMFLNSH